MSHLICQAAVAKSWNFEKLTPQKNAFMPDNDEPFIKTGDGDDARRYICILDISFADLRAPGSIGKQLNKASRAAAKNKLSVTADANVVVFRVATAGHVL